jgi:hypothetical protein
VLTPEALGSKSSSRSSGSQPRRSTRSPRSRGGSEAADVTRASV